MSLAPVTVIALGEIVFAWFLQVVCHVLLMWSHLCANVTVRTVPSANRPNRRKKLCANVTTVSFRIGN